MKNLDIGEGRGKTPQNLRGVNNDLFIISSLNSIMFLMFTVILNVFLWEEYFLNFIRKISSKKLDFIIKKKNGAI